MVSMSVVERLETIAAFFWVERFKGSILSSQTCTLNGSNYSIRVVWLPFDHLHLSVVTALLSDNVMMQTRRFL